MFCFRWDSREDSIIHQISHTFLKSQLIIIIIEMSIAIATHPLKQIDAI